MSDPVPAPQPDEPVPPGGSSGYPAALDLDAPLEVKNWRPLVNWLLAIPHMLVIYGLSIVAEILAFISLFTILFTKKNPFVDFQAMVLRYQWRTWSFAFWMRNEYPPFDFEVASADNGQDPAVVEIVPPEDLNRWLPLVKWLLAIPHVIVLAFLWIAVLVVAIIAFFAVLFTGRWPESLRSFVIGVSRWTLRVQAYGYVLLTDRYPPFSLE
jgi:hypothetical protein